MKIKDLDWIKVIATVSAFFGLLILIYFFKLINAAGLLFGEKINLQTANSIGSFVGGMVGAFWTLTGVLLYYSVIKAQKDESKKAESRHQEQIDLINLQKFQSYFFQLFNQFTQIRNTINTEDPHQSNITPIDVILNQILAVEKIDEEIDVHKKALLILNQLGTKNMTSLITYTEIFIMLFYSLNELNSASKDNYVELLINPLTDKEITIFSYYLSLYPNKDHSFVLNNKKWNERIDQLSDDLKIITSKLFTSLIPKIIINIPNRGSRL